jgi:phosphoglycolate phosphatase
MTLRLAIFDCDGTLVDGQAGVVNAMEAAFAGLGLAPPDRHLVCPRPTNTRCAARSD